MHNHPHPHPHDHAERHAHDAFVEPMRPPTQPSQAVMLDVGAHAGALVLTSSPEREGLEVEIHPESAPERRQHVWVLPRQGREGLTVYAAVFPSLAPGAYCVLEVDGTVRNTVSIPANRVTYAEWGEVHAPCAMEQAGVA